MTRPGDAALARRAFFGALEDLLETRYYGGQAVAYAVMLEPANAYTMAVRAAQCGRRVLRAVELAPEPMPAWVTLYPDREPDDAA